MADHGHTEYKHGSMDIREQEKTFAGFVKLSTWTVILTIAILIFMALANS
ncbi:aa3-type cytochrome c oxidase subunit IV [Neotabrizicola sp. sgz301269]